eukprot:15474686-Alexandrium_andersonii.AAC.1
MNQAGYGLRWEHEPQTFRFGPGKAIHIEWVVYGIFGFNSDDDNLYEFRANALPEHALAWLIGEPALLQIGAH